MLVRERLKSAAEKLGSDNYYLIHSTQSWVRWQVTRDMFWLYFCLSMLEKAESYITI
jgi:hypothetical protein